MESRHDKETHAAAQGERPVQAQEEVKKETVMLLGVLAAAYWFMQQSKANAI